MEIDFGVFHSVLPLQLEGYWRKSRGKVRRGALILSRERALFVTAFAKCSTKSRTMEAGRVGGRNYASGVRK